MEKTGQRQAPATALSCSLPIPSVCHFPPSPSPSPFTHQSCPPPVFREEWRLRPTQDRTGSEGLSPELSALSAGVPSQLRE